MTKRRSKYHATRYVEPDHGAIVRRYGTCSECAAEVQPGAPWKCPACGAALKIIRMAVEYEDGSIKSDDSRVRRGAHANAQKEMTDEQDAALSGS